MLKQKITIKELRKKEKEIEKRRHEERTKRKQLGDLCEKISLLTVDYPHFKGIQKLRLDAGDIKSYNELLKDIRKHHLLYIDKDILDGLSGFAALGLIAGSVSIPFGFGLPSLPNIVLLYIAPISLVGGLSSLFCALKYGNSKRRIMKKILEDQSFFNNLSSKFTTLEERSQYLLSEIQQRETWDFDEHTTRRLDGKIRSIYSSLSNNIKTAQQYNEIFENNKDLVERLCST